MVQEGDYDKTSGIFYVVLLQSELLFVAETWVVKPRIYKEVVSLHNQEAHWISGRVPGVRVMEAG